MLSAGTLTIAGQFLGTPDYAAPEQINGHPVDGRADQYALGCVAYEVLTGTVPFMREMPLAVLYAHLSTPPPQAYPRSPGPAARGQRGAQHRAREGPGARYPSCADFADALREALGLDPYDPSAAPAAHPDAADDRRFEAQAAQVGAAAAGRRSPGPRW